MSIRDCAKHLLFAVFAGIAMSSAHALPLMFHAFLDGPSEIPPNASPGTGEALITLDPVAHTMRVQASFADLIGTTTVVHIHCCTATPGTGTVGVATMTPLFTGFPVGVTAGTYDETFDTTLAATFNAPFVTANGGVAGAEAALLAGMTNSTAYFNIHSSFAGGGEIRGFLTPVPEPLPVAMVALGLAALGGTSLRTRRPLRVASRV